MADNRVTNLFSLLGDVGVGDGCLVAADNVRFGYV